MIIILLSHRLSSTPGTLRKDICCFWKNQEENKKKDYRFNHDAMSLTIKTVLEVKRWLTGAEKWRLPGFTVYGTSSTIVITKEPFYSILIRRPISNLHVAKKTLCAWVSTNTHTQFSCNGNRTHECLSVRYIGLSLDTHTGTTIPELSIACQWDVNGPLTSGICRSIKKTINFTRRWRLAETVSMMMMPVTILIGYRMCYRRSSVL